MTTKFADGFIPPNDQLTEDPLFTISQGEIEIGKTYHYFKGKFYKVFLFSTAKNDYQEGDIYPCLSLVNPIVANSISKGQDVVIYYEEVGSGREYWARSLKNFE